MPILMRIQIYMCGKSRKENDKRDHKIAKLVVPSVYMFHCVYLFV